MNGRTGRAQLRAELPQPWREPGRGSEQQWLSSMAWGRSTQQFSAVIWCAGHSLPNKTTDLCLWMLLTISIADHPFGFVSVGFVDQAGQIENSHVFCQIAEKSSVQHLEVLLLLFSHTDSKPIIPSLISILWTVCSFEQVFCFLSYLNLGFLAESCEEFCHRPFVSLSRSCQVVFVWLL